MLLFAAVAVLAQGLVQDSDTEHKKPLPDIGPMMQKVIANEHASEAMQPDYLVSEWLSSWDGQGRTWSQGSAHGSSWRSTNGEEKESEVFWLRGIRVSRLVRIAGTKGIKRTYDHALTAEELRQENARIDAELSDIAKARAMGDVDDERNEAGGLDEIRMSRLLELGTFSNPRWGKDDPEGRNMIDVDYKGELCSHDCSPLDAAASKIAGTVTIDEEGLAVAEFNGVFADTWMELGKSGWRVLKGSELHYWSARQNGGIRFPGIMYVETTVHHGSSFTTHTVGLTYRDHKKFRVTSTILPDVTFLPDSALHEAPPGRP